MHIRYDAVHLFYQHRREAESFCKSRIRIRCKARELIRYAVKDIPVALFKEKLARQESFCDIQN
jgi:hypothetical protein